MLEAQEPEPDFGPKVSRKAGRPFRARRDDEGRVWVMMDAVRARLDVSEAVARAWVADRRVFLVRLDGKRCEVLGEDVEVDDERQQVLVVGRLLDGE